jgi:hypothetical protein
MNQQAARKVAMSLLAGVVLFPSAAHAGGIGNLTYTQDELEKPISLFGGDGASKFDTGPTGSNTVLVLRKVMIVMGSNDSGKPPGALHVFDVSDPRHPKLLHTLAGTPETSQLRELHAMPVAMIDGKDFLVLPTTGGLQFFDFTDPMNPKPSGSVALAGVNGGDYDNAAWMLSWAWPYVYAGGTGNGVYIVDATDPAKPTLLTRITSAELGNFRVGPTYAAGNYLVAGQMDQGTTHYAIIDVSTPKSPFLLGNGETPDSLYSSVVIGDRIYGPGTNGSYSFLKWTPGSATTAAGVSIIHRDTSGSDRGGYCGYSDGFVICGQSSEGYKKWDVRDEANIKQVGHGTDPAGVGGDFDFATILANLVYLGNDHGTGAALIPHSMAPDTTPPKVLNVFPSDKEQKVATTTRITIFFSDDLDLDSVTTKSIIVRKNGACTPLDGVLSKSSFNAISFGTRQPLDANATYDVVVPAGGIKDLAGNAIQAGAIAHFSTGATIDAITPCPGDGEVVASGNDAGVAPPPPDAGMVMGAAGAGGGAAAMGGSSGEGGMSILGGAGSSMVEGTGGTGGHGGSGALAPSASDTGGCGCTVPGRARGQSAAWLFGLAAALGATRARRRRASRGA